VDILGGNLEEKLAGGECPGGDVLHSILQWGVERGLLWSASLLALISHSSHPQTFNHEVANLNDNG